MNQAVASGRVASGLERDVRHSNRKPKRHQTWQHYFRRLASCEHAFAVTVHRAVPSHDAPGPLIQNRKAQSCGIVYAYARLTQMQYRDSSTYTVNPVRTSAKGTALRNLVSLRVYNSFYGLWPACCSNTRVQNDALSNPLMCSVQSVGVTLPGSDGSCMHSSGWQFFAHRPCLLLPP